MPKGDRDRPIPFAAKAMYGKFLGRGVSRHHIL